MPTRLEDRILNKLSQFSAQYFKFTDCEIFYIIFFRYFFEQVQVVIRQSGAKIGEFFEWMGIELSR